MIQICLLEVFLFHQLLFTCKVIVLGHVVSIVVSGDVPKLVKPDCSQRSTHHSANLLRDLISTKPKQQLSASF